MTAVAALSLRSLRTSRGDALGLPLVAIGSFVFLYIIQPLSMIHSGAAEAFLTEWQLAKALLVPAAMLPCFVWGWRREPAQFSPRRRPPWKPLQLWNFGFGTALAGLCVYIIFLQRSGGILQSFSQPHGHAMAWEENTAYLYNGPWWMLSGMAMMICANTRLKLTGWRKAAFAVFFVIVLGHALLTGSRGPLFSACGTVFVSYSIAMRRTPRLAQTFAVLAVLGFGVLLMVGYRDVLHLGQDKSEAPTLSQALNSSLQPGDYEKAHGTTGLEFIFHAAVLDTVDKSNKYHLGLGWVSFLVLNPIPRLLWPDKHYPESPGITFDDILQTTGLAVAGGAAPGIVADLYAQFGLGESLFLYWLGRLSRRLFTAARRLHSPLTMCAYVMLYAVSLNMFAQGFGAIFVSFGYSMIPAVLHASLAGLRTRRRAALLRGHFASEPRQVPQVQC
jgi:hypothetical protein